jgi:hypothetical protein
MNVQSRGDESSETLLTNISTYEESVLVPRIIAKPEKETYVTGNEVFVLQNPMYEPRIIAINPSWRFNVCIIRVLFFFLRHVNEGGFDFGGPGEMRSAPLSVTEKEKNELAKYVLTAAIVYLSPNIKWREVLVRLGLRDEDSVENTNSFYDRMWSDSPHPHNLLRRARNK